MRRWRVSYLKTIGTPETLLKAWIGHANGNDIMARYDKSAGDKEWRQTWANKCGVGFDIPELCAGRPAPKAKTVGAVKPHRSQALESQSPSYVAEDSDLPELFFEASEHAV
jgi:hypothetical protein